MNKHLNNWFDKVEGLPENTTNNNIIKEMKRQRYCHHYSYLPFIESDLQDECGYCKENNKHRKNNR